MAGLTDEIKKNASGKKGEPVNRFALVVTLSNLSGLPKKGAPGVGEKSFKEYCAKNGIDPEGNGLTVKGKVQTSFSSDVAVGSDVSVTLSPQTNTLSILKNLSAGYVSGPENGAAGSRLVLEGVSIEGGKLTARWGSNASDTHRGIVQGFVGPEAIFWKDANGKATGINLGSYSSRSDEKKMSTLDEKMKSLAAAAMSDRATNIRVVRTVYQPGESRLIGQGNVDIAALTAEIGKIAEKGQRAYAIRLSVPGDSLTITGEVRTVAGNDGKEVLEPVKDSLDRALSSTVGKEGVKKKVERLEAAGCKIELIPGNVLSMAFNPSSPVDNTTVKHVNDLIERYNAPDDNKHEKFLRQAWMTSGVREGVMITLPTTEAHPVNPPYLSVVQGSSVRYNGVNEIPTPHFDGVNNRPEAAAKTPAPEAPKEPVAPEAEPEDEPESSLSM